MLSSLPHGRRRRGLRPCRSRLGQFHAGGDRCRALMRGSVTISWISAFATKTLWIQKRMLHTRLNHDAMTQQFPRKRSGFASDLVCNQSVHTITCRTGPFTLAEGIKVGSQQWIYEWMRRMQIVELSSSIQLSRLWSETCQPIRKQYLLLADEVESRALNSSIAVSLSSKVRV